MERKRMLIEADELLTKIDQGNIRIYDASVSEDMYLKGHIPGAVFFDHEKFSDPQGKYDYTILPDAELVARIEEVGISNNSEVIVYAAGMMPFAARAWWLLRYAGHENVRLLNGGLSAWQAAGGQVEQASRRYEAGVFKSNFRRELIASQEDVLRVLEDANVAIVNVLPAVSYEGSHITGSICVPCMELMQGMDAFLPTDKLAERLKGVDRQRIITYCGGGIAAAVNAMAHMLVGQEDVALYDGSMAEWIGEGLPVTGNGKWEIWK